MKKYKKIEATELIHKQTTTTQANKLEKLKLKPFLFVLTFLLSLINLILLLYLLLCFKTLLFCFFFLMLFLLFLFVFITLFSFLNIRHYNL
ncbi:hypothetical protein AYWB_319 [Aster yellows witches'-broom phytoplasma AYWB]|uniref:Uncharacterized protein n=1 Tax=Aster yellows witches'-broom phytoplasma (strain AYWB) TaxID=322098 RepID=Q2NJF7_AYWBP|nr:hypothetical protein AYWB_319 [Aster yellows witches'-broom phytoplasma AYWB]